MPKFAADLAEKGVEMLDAPVSGGEIGAIQGTLSIMVGGDAAALERVRPILNAMGNPERVIHIGESGAGQICKVCNQMAIGGTLAGLGFEGAGDVRVGRGVAIIQQGSGLPGLDQACANVT